MDGWRNAYLDTDGLRHFNKRNQLVEPLRTAHPSWIISCDAIKGNGHPVNEGRALFQNILPPYRPIRQNIHPSYAVGFVGQSHNIRKIITHQRFAAGNIQYANASLHQKTQC